MYGLCNKIPETTPPPLSSAHSRGPRQRALLSRLRVSRVRVVALFALVEDGLPFIDGTHLHRVEAQLVVLALRAGLGNLRHDT